MYQVETVWLNIFSAKCFFRVLVLWSSTKPDDSQFCIMQCNKTAYMSIQLYAQRNVFHAWFILCNGRELVLDVFHFQWGESHLQSCASSSTNALGSIVNWSRELNMNHVYPSYTSYQLCYVNNLSDIMCIGSLHKVLNNIWITGIFVQF